MESQKQSVISEHLRDSFQMEAGLSTPNGNPQLSMTRIRARADQSPQVQLVALGLLFHWERPHQHLFALISPSQAGTQPQTEPALAIPLVQTMF